MKVETKTEISKEEIELLIREKYGIEGNIEFIVKEEQYKVGWCDGIQHYDSRWNFNGVIITEAKELKIIE
jgi:hypothetical protein